MYIISHAPHLSEHFFLSPKHYPISDQELMKTMHYYVNQKVLPPENKSKNV